MITVVWLALTSKAYTLELRRTCDGPEPTAVAPADGGSDVSPDAVPALLVDANCGTGDIDLVWSVNDIAPVDSVLHVDHHGIQWLPDLDLVADTSYSLQATNHQSVSTTFLTGSGPLPDVTGAPALTITGSQRARGITTVSLDVAVAPDSTSGLYEVRRDGTVFTSGIGDGTVVDSLEAERGDELCYTVTQYLADSTVLGTSDKACVTVKGCSTTGTAPSANFALLAAALIRRGRRVLGPGDGDASVRIGDPANLRHAPPEM